MSMSLAKQRTLARSISYQGIGLHAALEVHMVLHPAPVDTGIVFVRTDMETHPSVKANLSYVTNTMRATTLEDGEAKVFTVEHLLSALYGLQIDNCIIEMDSPEPPVGDGSSLVFVQLLREAGVQIQEANKKELIIQQQHRIEEEDKFAAIIPYNGYRITFISINPHPLLGVQFFDFEITEESYVKEVAFARTVAFTKALEMLRQLGLGKGGTLENAVVYDETSCLSTLRSADELVRHKVLDMIGDLALLGKSIRGHVIAVKSSHKLNNLLTHDIIKEFV